MNEDEKIYLTENANLPELVVTPTKNSPEEKEIEQAYLNRFKNRRLDIPVNNTSAQLKWFKLGILRQRDALHNSPWMWGLRGLAAAPAAVIAPLAGSVTKAVVTNPYTDALLTSSAGAHGIQSLANGEADWTTALEVAPMFRLAKPIWNAGKLLVSNTKIVPVIKSKTLKVPPKYKATEKFIIPESARNASYRYMNELAGQELTWDKIENFVQNNPDIILGSYTIEDALAPRPGWQYLMKKYPDVRFKYDVKNMYNWYKKDIAPRLFKSSVDEETLVQKLPKNMHDKLGQGMQFKLLNIPDKRVGGWEYDGNINVRWGPDIKTTLLHEFHHAYREKLQNTPYRNSYGDLSPSPSWQEWIDYQKRSGVGSGYTQKEAEYLDDAYTFTDDFIKRNDIQPLYEKGATNVELRYALSENGKLHGKALNDKIYDMDWDTYTNLLNSISSYSRNFKKFLESKMSTMDPVMKQIFKEHQLCNVKNAMKYVGALTGGAYVGNKVNEDSKNDNIQ